MPTKYELASYLVSLHTLMAAIDPTPPWLAAEYQKHWDELKQKVKEPTK